MKSSFSEALSPLAGLDLDRKRHWQRHRAAVVLKRRNKGGLIFSRAFGRAPPDASSRVPFTPESSLLGARGGECLLENLLAQRNEFRDDSLALSSRASESFVPREREREREREGERERAASVCARGADSQDNSLDDASILQQTPNFGEVVLVTFERKGDEIKACRHLQF